jgi:hypothetical protein
MKLLLVFIFAFGPFFYMLIQAVRALDAASAALGVK